MEYKYRSLSKEDVINIENQHIKKLSELNPGSVPILDRNKLIDAMSDTSMIDKIRSEIRKEQELITHEINMYAICEMALLYLESQNEYQKGFEAGTDHGKQTQCDSCDYFCSVEDAYKMAYKDGIEDYLAYLARYASERDIFIDITFGNLADNADNMLKITMRNQEKDPYTMLFDKKIQKNINLDSILDNGDSDIDDMDTLNSNSRQLYLDATIKSELLGDLDLMYRKLKEENK